MKLKIPKYDNEEDNKILDADRSLDFDHQKKIQSKERVCEVCNRVFSSGKALGGHMRIHFQAYKSLILKENLKKKMRAQQSIKFKKLTKSSNKSDGIHEVGSCVEPKCALCGKIFPSMKSLFGHMRCHPEREWRGIHPPPPPPPPPSPPLHAKNSSVSWSTTSEAELIDDEFLEVLPKWSVTAKRGRKAVNMVVDDHVEEEFLEAVDDLMMLAKGGGDSCDHVSSHLTQKHQKGERFEVTNSNSLSNNDVLMKSEGKCNNKKNNVVESDDEFGSSECRIDGKKGLIIKNRERKKMKLRGLEHIYLQKDSVFSSFPMINISGNMESESNPQLQDSAPLMFNQSPPLVMVAVAPPCIISPEKHKCTICGKSFPTHQALGGHKSSHYKFKMFIQNSIDDHQYYSPPSQSVSVQDEVKSHATGTVLDFDLNVLPPVEQNLNDDASTPSRRVTGTNIATFSCSN